MGEGLTTPHREKPSSLRNVTQGLELARIILERPTQWIIDMGYGTWNVRSVCRSDSLKTVASELTKCRVDLIIPMQLFRWENGGSQPTDDFTFSIVME
jgi:hypothetical protein